MKKSAIIIACLLLSNISAFALDVGVEGSNPGVMNKQNAIQLQELQVEKKYIETTTDKPDNKSIKENESIQDDILKEGLTYNPKFKLNKVIFQGNTVYSDKKLSDLTSKLINKDIYIADVLDLVVEVSRFYQRNGYLTSYAYLPPQEIREGVIVINIKESRVSKKEAVGERWEREWFFKNVALTGRGLQEDKVFNSKDLQGSMKNINKEAYLHGTAEITKDKEENTEIKLHVEDRFPLKLSLGWDDFGRNYTGRQRFTSVVGLDNVTGIGDKIYAGAILSSGTTGALAGYQIPVNKYGTKLAFDYSYSSLVLGGPYLGENLKGNATDLALRLTHPLINTATKELTASVSVDSISSKSNSFSTGNYELRVLRTGLYGMFDDRHGRTISNVGVDVGVDGLGATASSDNGRQSAFYKIVAGVSRIQRLPKSCLGIIRLNTQFTPNSLFAAEQMYVGGVYSVRGYQPSELLGDYGASGTFELRTPVPGLKRILPAKVKNVSDRVKLAFFYDWGFVGENTKLYDYPSSFLSSVGVGTYVNLTDAIYAQMGVGIPVGPKNHNDDKARFYFSLNTDIDRIFMKPKERL